MDTHDLQSLQNQTRPSTLMDEGVRLRAAEKFGLELGVTNGSLCLSQRKRQWGVALVALSVALLVTGGVLVLPEFLLDPGFASEAVRLTSLTFAACLFLLSACLPFVAVDVQVSRRKIERVLRCWRFRLGSQTVRADAVADLSIDPGRSGTLGRSYDLVGRGDFGKLKLVDGIPDREFLDAIRRQIMLAAGLRPSGTH